MTVEEWMLDLVPLPVLLPLVGAGLALVVRNRTRLQRAVSVVTLTCVLVISGVLLWGADHLGTQVVQVGGWVPPQGITLVVDRLSALMVVVAVVVTFGVLLYAIGQGRGAMDRESGARRGDRDSITSAPVPIFHPTLLVLLAGVSTTFISGDLFHMYVGFEMLLAASFVLLTLGGSADRVRAGMSYVFVSLVSSSIFLIALAMVYAATGTVNLAQLSVRIAEIPAGTSLLLQLLLLTGFAVKAAVFPMSGWLPDAYPTAPAPVTAVFAGLLTKVGVYAMIRTQTLLFPGSPLQTLLLWAALLTMLVGILGAVAQDDLKRMLSFTLVSHIGYMVLGIGLGSVTGLSAAIFYVAHHITIQTTLFLVAGLVERRAGSTSMARLGGLARMSPLLAVLFFLPAFNLAGIPPFSGFLAKVGLLQAGAQQGGGLVMVVLAGSVLTSLLTLYAVSRVWTRAFWRTPAVAAITEENRLERRYERMHAMAPGVVLPTAALVLVGVGLTLVAGPLFGITDRAAADLLAPAGYVRAVFGDVVP
ncbi:Na+/H+ antiporter subunit D [Auraticoccus monumenti]|uniref:Multisubunit sodium/proton antiporter, MrpD subunit n=1 Tax=Auraticoccus monumenti TaxID=675864 RepID=A0A1G6VH86_9ACTN|nr:Na+/H+ antiporter subunit D [Auraticoccus monumenti]SDD52417.1 multisubunit sodium/proton antiporter, MrpD subunit [Auraticoccus monumenti]